jgi:hypothetical protein
MLDKFLTKMYRNRLTQEYLAFLGNLRGATNTQAQRHWQRKKLKQMTVQAAENSRLLCQVGLNLFGELKTT